MNLKQVRLQANKTQAEIANIIGTNQNTYSNYETEKTEPSIKTLIDLANYFDVSLDYLCGRQYNNKIGYIPDDKKELVKTLLKLNNEDCSKLQGYMSALLDKK